ncbi:restriction endonuclease subunit S [Rhodobacter sp. Har01]|uniref:restriction endonuclease subunit S n=1 Tax=Rhodobacter sp. Har01 TaxID=2883999 RepID=UPI001D076CB4|nr:restriction endonuclease subunit S [Rhodobacter sp. Har01]MCB6179030.1 restriction endonuclease subunit S [Rhodobacter sp. Har01]
MKDGIFSAERLLALYDRVAEAEDAIPRLRRFVLDLAVRGKLVEQDPSDEPAAELLRRIAKEKARLVKAGEIRKPKTLPPVDLRDVHIDMPIGWRCARVGELSTVITKGSTPTSYGHAYAVTGVNFIKVESIRKGRIAPDRITSFISEETNEFLSRSKLREGDLLFSIAGTIGTCALVTAEILPANTNQALAIIRGTGFVFEADFLIVALRSFVSNAILDKARGGAMNNVSLDDIQNLIVPLPPLVEQQRIVAKVDELMALCDRLEAARAGREAVRDRLTAATWARLTAPETDAETFPTPSFQTNARFALKTLPTLTTRPDQIKTLRQTILNLAVRGKLLEQDPTDEPATELLKRISRDKSDRAVSARDRRATKIRPLSSNEAPSDIPANWVWASFGDVAISRDGDRVPVSREERERRAKVYDYYGASGVIDKIDGFLFDKPLLLIGEDGANLINRSTPIAFIARGKYWVNNHAHVLDGISEGFLRYLELFINAIDLKPYVTGTAQPKMNQAKMNSIPVALPPLAEQRRIVAKVDALMALCDQLEASLTTATTTRSRLLESLLHEALAPVAEPITKAAE